LFAVSKRPAHQLANETRQFVVFDAEWSSVCPGHRVALVFQRSDVLGEE
jgi:hypothetical protein